MHTNITPHEPEVNVIQQKHHVVSLFEGRLLDKRETSLPSSSSTAAIVGKGLWTKW